MQQLDIFSFTSSADRSQNGRKGLLHRCHIYHKDQFVYTAFPSLKGMKVIGIRSSQVHDMTVDEYRAWIDENEYEEREME